MTVRLTADEQAAADAMYREMTGGPPTLTAEQRTVLYELRDEPRSAALIAQAAGVGWMSTLRALTVLAEHGLAEHDFGEGGWRLPR